MSPTLCTRAQPWMRRRQPGEAQPNHPAAIFGRYLACACTALHCIVDMPWRSSCYLMLGPCLLTTPLPAPIGWLVYLQGHHGVPGAAAHRHAAQAPHRGHLLPAVSTCTHARIRLHVHCCTARLPNHNQLLHSAAHQLLVRVSCCAPVCPAVPRCACCSADVERLAFSVIWEVTEQAEVSLIWQPATQTVCRELHAAAAVFLPPAWPSNMPTLDAHPRSQLHTTLYCTLLLRCRSCPAVSPRVSSAAAQR